MPKSCAVADCQNSKKRRPDLTFHRFPLHNRNLLKVWKNRCKRHAQFKVANSCVCSDHFVEEDYERDLQNELLGLPVKRKLKKDAIPTIFKFRRESNAGDKASSARNKRMEERRRKKLVNDIILGESANESVTAGNDVITNNEEIVTSIMDTELQPAIQAAIQEVTVIDEITEISEYQSAKRSISTQTIDDGVWQNELKKRYEAKFLSLKKRYESKLFTIKSRLQNELGTAKSLSVSLTSESAKWRSLVFSYVLKNVRLKNELQLSRRNADKMIRSIYSYSQINAATATHAPPPEQNGPSLEDHSYC